MGLRALYVLSLATIIALYSVLWIVLVILLANTFMYKTAMEVARALCSIFREYGCPKIIHSDNGKEFVANVVTSMCSNLGIAKIHGRPYHPQSQGQVESLNKKVKQFIAARLLSFSPDQQSDVWPWLLPEAAHFLNNTWHSTINEVPFTAFYGRESGQFCPATSGLYCGLMMIYIWHY